MKTKILLLFWGACALANAQMTWDFKTGTEGWGSYGDDIAITHDGSEKMILTCTGGGDAAVTYPTIYNDSPLNVAGVNYFYMKFNATNWPKSSVLVNIYFEMGGNNYYANQTMNVASGEFSFNIRSDVQHAWSILPATGTTSRIRIEIPHNSELAGSNWNGAVINIDKIAFYSSPTTALNDNQKQHFSLSPNPAVGSFRVTGDDIERLSIYDVTGKLVQSVTENIDRISVTDFAKGLYFVKIDAKGQTIVEKLIVK